MFSLPDAIVGFFLRFQFEMFADFLHISSIWGLYFVGCWLLIIVFLFIIYCKSLLFN